jgi:D-3-phosphoglycerate dehydrogenase / 2-oxoglutarate reductase
MTAPISETPIRVLVTDWEFDDLDVERAGLEPAGLELVHAQCRTPQEVLDAAKDTGARALLVQYAPITGEVIRGIPGLGIVARYGVGVDNVDLEAARERDVWVCNVTDYGDEEVATHASALALSAARGLPWHDRAVRSQVWDYKQGRPMHRLSERSLGVLGLGRIGRRVAQVLGPFFGEVLGADPYLREDRWPAGVHRRTVDELFEEAHVLTLHLPLTEDTHHLVDAGRLATMREGAILVNTSRGGLVDAQALRVALDDGPLAAAALDVLESEPAPADHPLTDHPRALVTPHTAWYSAESEVILRRGAVANVVAWASGEVPAYAVIDPR